MGAAPLECTFVEADDDYRFIFKLGNSTHKLSVKDVKDYIYPHYVYLEYSKTSKNIGESTDEAAEPVQESKYQKYLATKKNNVVKESDNNDSLEVGKEYKTDSNLGGIFNVTYKGKTENGNHNFEVSKGEFKGQKHSVKPENLGKYLVK